MTTATQPSMVDIRAGLEGLALDNDMLDPVRAAVLAVFLPWCTETQRDALWAELVDETRARAASEGRYGDPERYAAAVSLIDDAFERAGVR
jgi:hypothetical protein